MSVLKVTVLQQNTTNTPKAEAKFLDNEISKIIATENKKPDVVIFPEGWFQMIDGPITEQILEDIRVKPIIEVIKKHKVFAILGSFTEIENKNNYVTSLFISDEGKLIGFYRKRKPTREGAHSSGDKIGVFDTSFGRAGIMICFDVENEDIFNETLKAQPSILFNPTYIPAPSTANNTDLFISDWRIAMETMSRKFETICGESDINILRCDAPFSNQSGAFGSSQLIGTYATYYTPHFSPQTFSVFIDRDKKNNFPDITNSFAPIRTSKRDNNGSRYTVYSFFGHQQKITQASFIDNIKIGTISLDNTLKMWNMHSMKCLSSVNLKNPWNCFAFLKSSNKMIGGSNGSLIFHNALNLTYLESISIPGTPSKLVVPSSLPDSLLCGTEDGKLFIIDTLSGEIHHKGETSSNSITSILSNENKLFASSGTSIFEFDIRALDKIVQTFQGNSNITSLALCNQLLLAGQVNDELLAFDLTGKLTLNAPCVGVNSISTVSNYHVFAGCTDGNIKLFSINKDKSQSKLLHTMYGHTMAVRGLEHDGTSRILSFGDELVPKIWNFSQNRKPSMLKNFFVE